MIVRPESGSLLFITQPDHAVLAADLADRFDGLDAHPRRDEIRLAVREHDNGWRELDDEIVFDAVNGRALDFITAPESLKQSVWPLGIDRLAAESAYAAALVAAHALFVYSAHRGEEDWRAFFANQHGTMVEDPVTGSFNAGVAGLVAAYVLGARRGYGSDNLAPYDLTLAVIGSGLLWVGWFGFNGGSALGANSRAAMAIVSTHLAASAGAFTWMALEWWTRGKPSVLGMISGAVAGLGTITPASGFVLPMQGVLIGIIAGAICFWACTWLKLKIGYDDSLDVFGVHGIGGFTGTLLAGVFAVGALSATPETPGGIPGLLEGNPHQVVAQLYGIAVTLVWSGGLTFVILKVISALVPLRVKQEDEVMGLDVSQHGEAIQ